MNLEIILWSTSPRRKEILSILGIPFDILPSDYEEDMSLQEEMPATELAIFLAKGKGESILHKLEQEKRKAIIISADTFIVFKDKCLGKPFTEEKQKAMLASFSGQMVQVITWIYVCNKYTGQVWSEAISSDICFKTLTGEQIERYIATQEWLDRAWWFAIQGKGNMLIDYIRGDWYNILWLPLSRIYDILEECSVFV